MAESAQPLTTFQMTDVDRKHHKARIRRFSATRNVNSSLRGKQSVVKLETAQH